MLCPGNYRIRFDKDRAGDGKIFTHRFRYQKFRGITKGIWSRFCTTLKTTAMALDAIFWIIRYNFFYEISRKMATEAKVWTQSVHNRHKSDETRYYGFKGLSYFYSAQ